jgi:hypothetical protein
MARLGGTGGVCRERVCVLRTRAAQRDWLLRHALRRVPLASARIAGGGRDRSSRPEACRGHESRCQPRHDRRRPAGTTGIVAAKHWHPLSGSLGYGSANLSTLVFLAWILIVVAGIATIACVAAARAAGVTGRSRYRWIALVVGAAIAVALPLVLGYHHGHMMGLRSLAAYALLYSLPWGAAIAVSGWLDRVVALTALATVVVSAAGAVVSHDILPVASPSHGFVPVVVVTIALAALMFRERRQVREAGEATENSDV